MKTTALAIVLALAVLGLSGCAGDKGPREIEVAPGQVVVVEEPPKPGNGIVAGIVGNDAIYPLGGVLVKIVGLGLNSTSDENGRFAILNVPPGIYILEGSKKDHAPVQTTVDVQPDKTARAVLLLPRIPPTDPYHITFDHNGFVTFYGLGARAGAANTSFQFRLDPSKAVTLVLESKWNTQFVMTGQTKPLVYEISDVGLRRVESDEENNPFTRHIDARILTPGHVNFNVRIEPNMPEPVVYSARSQNFLTVFYNQPAPADWGILRGST
jgi:hypothetical protein